MNAIAHKHAELIKQWADAPEWWDVYWREPATSSWTKVTLTSTWASNYEYELRKSAKHPDNIKPKKRLIDWSKMPRGTMTNSGELLRMAGSFGAWVLNEPRNGTAFAYVARLRLAEQTQFTYWGGGECPVPEGVTVSYIMRCWKELLTEVPRLQDWKHVCGGGCDIIAYRITGLADGWTDNPDEAV